VAPSDNPSLSRPLTTDTKRPLQRYSWAPDSRSILFVNDNDGDENYRLFSVATDGGPVRSLLETSGAQVSIEAISTRVPNRIVVSINDRDPKWPDLYSIDLRTGERSLLLRNDGHFVKFLFDDDLALRLVTRATDDGGYDLYEVVSGKVASEPYDEIPFEEMQTSRPLGFSGDGRALLDRQPRPRHRCPGRPGRRDRQAPHARLRSPRRSFRSSPPATANGAAGCRTT
jgi:hypothetical protein